MAKDIIITVNTETDQIIKNSDTLGISSENLQGKIILTPTPFVDGVCRMHIEGHGSILMDKQEDCYTLDIKSSLLIAPGIDICFKITEPEQENGIPIYATKIMRFKVLETIDEKAEIEEQYPTLIQELQIKVEELEKKVNEGGNTPVRGVDYWTEEDISAIEQHCNDYIDAKIIDAIGGVY